MKQPASNPPAHRTPKHQKLPTGIWVLGFVSLCMDTSSELIHSLLPLFMTSVLGASMATIGVIEGVAEATAAITKVFSGVISDILNRRKALAVFGYSLSAITKPIFPLAMDIAWVFGAKFIDRIGKGIRSAPRDALIAEIVPSSLRGKAYGLRQALDSVGAFLGPMLALLLMILMADHIQSAMWIGVFPAIVAVLLLAFGVKESNGASPQTDKKIALIHLAEIRTLGLDYWRVVLLGAMFMMARFSEAFLLLRAQSAHLTMAYIPAVMIVMNVVYAATSYPSGLAADHANWRRYLLQAGLLVLILADLLLAVANSPGLVFAGTALWGLHMGMTQGLFSKMVADKAKNELLGSAFGIFNLVTGLTLLIASVLAGYLWDRNGPASTFIAGSGFATVTLIGIVFHQRRSARSHHP